MCTNFDELFNIINEKNYDRLKVGKSLRKITYKNILPILFACMAYEYIENKKLNSMVCEIDEILLKNIVEKYKKFFDFILAEDLLHIDKMKPLFNGKEIIKILNIKAGKEVGLLIDYLLDEQIKDSSLDKNKAIELLKIKKDEIFVNAENNDKNNNSSNKKNKKGK